MKPEAALSTNQADHGLAVQRGAIPLSPDTTEAATMVPNAFITGHPVKHSRSPLVHHHWLATYGIPGSYEAIDVAPAEFPAFFRGFRERGYVGGNFTIPHKEAAFRLVDEPSEDAQRMEAVNTVWLDDGRIRGDNTDVLGFMANLDQTLGVDWSATTGNALVLGAGGAARAVVAGLLDRLGDDVIVANRTLERAQQLLPLAPGRVRPLEWSKIEAVLPRVDLVVNTTSLGMVGQPPLSIDLTLLPDRAVVSDIVYVPLETPILAAARARGLRTVGGLGMLLHQAVPGFAHWFGVTPQVTPELHALVEADVQERL